MIYTLSFTENAKEDMVKLKKSEPQAFRKLIKLLEELMEHPHFGSGKVEKLKGNLSGLWSRRITEKHRLVYEIHEQEVKVLVLNSYGHYADK
jgi:toxin YoeB